MQAEQINRMAIVIATDGLKTASTYMLIEAMCGTPEKILELADLISQAGEHIKHVALSMQANASASTVEDIIEKSKGFKS